MDFYKMATEAWARQTHPRDPERLARRLLAAPERQRQILLANDRQLASVQVCRALLKRCESLRRVDVGAYVAAASAAVATAEAVSGVPETLRADLRAESWAEWGNSLRVRGDLKAARSAFEVAREAVPCGTGDPLVEGQVLWFAASFAREAGDLDEAVEWGLEAVEIFDEVGEDLQAARAQVSLAMAYASWLDWLSALRHLEKALKRPALAENRELLAVAAHNFVVYLSEAGYPRLALQVAATTEPMYSCVPGGADLRARFLWLRAGANRQLGKPHSAAKLFREASDAFLSLGRLNDSAVATLEAAAALFECGDFPGVARLADRAATALLRLGSTSGALAAIMVLKTAAGASTVTAELVDDLKRRLESERKAAGDPTAGC